MYSDIRKQNYYLLDDDNYIEENTTSNWLGFLLFILLVLVIAVGIRYLMQASSFPIKHINIEGQFVYLDEQSLQALANQSIKGGFFSLNVDAIRQQMQREPWVETITVRRIWPDALAINVIEQTPIALWNGVSLLNHKGSVFTPDINTLPNKLPSVTAPEGTEELILKELHRVKKEIQDLGIALTSIHLSERRSWKLSFNNLEVLLGKTEFEKRLQRFIELVPIALNENFTNISLIDLRYTNGFSVKREESKQLLSDKLMKRSEASEKI